MQAILGASPFFMVKVVAARHVSHEGHRSGFCWYLPSPPPGFIPSVVLKFLVHFIAVVRFQGPLLGFAVA